MDACSRSRYGAILPGAMDGNPWWRTALIGISGLVWRKRWIISVVGLLLILLPTLTVFGSYVVAWVVEHVLRVLSPVPALTSKSGRNDLKRRRAENALLPPAPSFGDPFRQQGGPV